MSDVLEFIRGKAKELYPDNEKQAEEFVEGFLTKAASWRDYVNLEGPVNVLTSAATKDRPAQYRRVESPMGTGLGRGVGESIGKAIVGGGVGIAASAIASMARAVNEDRLHKAFTVALNEAMQMNRVLKSADKNKVLNFARTIFKFAPHVATDPNLLSSILANAIHGDGVDPMTIRTLTELESRYVDTRSFSPKQWI